jgi:hypothetical protein
MVGMSNDDREAPRWGERVPEPEQPAAPQPSAHEPTAAQPTWGAPEQPSAPQYSAPQAPQYSAPQAPQYGTPQPQYGGPAFGTPQGGPAQGGPAQGGWAPGDQKRPRTVGVIALVAGIIALALGVVGGIVFGNALASIPGFAHAAQNGDSSGFEQSIENNPSAAGPIIISVFIGLAGTVFGIWAIVQGIVAAVTRRGRALGVVAIILAVVAPILFGVLYAVIAVSGAV